MNSQVLGLRVAGTISGLVCLAHALRVVTRAELVIAGHVVPQWASAIAVVIAGWREYLDVEAVQPGGEIGGKLCRVRCTLTEPLTLSRSSQSGAARLV
jgi:hypothetical protein